MPDKWRVGRTLGRTLYYQLGDEPSKDDHFLGLMENRALAERVAAAVNRDLAAAGGCSCTASRVVVIHDRHTPCGEQQHDHVGLAALDAAARAGACPDDMPLIHVAVTAVLDTLTDSQENTP